MEPIQDDIETVRSFLLLYAGNRRAMEALDRLVAELADVKMLFLAEQQGRKRREAERDRLREALERIAAMEAEPVKPDGRTCIEVAREALTKTTEEE